MICEISREGKIAGSNEISGSGVEWSGGRAPVVSTSNAVSVEDEEKDEQDEQDEQNEGMNES